MSTVAEIQKELKDYKPELRDTSLKAYALNINKMLKNDVDLDDIKSIREYLKKYKQTTIANYASSISIYSKMQNKPKDFVDEVEKIRNEAHQHYEELVNENKKTDRQEKNWLPWDEIVELSNKLYDEAMEIGVKNKGVELTPDKRRKMQDGLMLALYVHHPMRNDTAELKVLTATEEKTIDPKWKKNTNYMVCGGKQCKIVLNNYKTSRKYGRREIDIPESIQPLLKMWLRQYNKSGYLFTNGKHAPLSSNGVSKAFIRLFNEHKDKNISTSMLRHIYLSDKYEPQAEERKKDAEKLMHSTLMQNGYIKKGD